MADLGLWCPLSPSCQGPEGGWDKLGFTGNGDSSVRTSLPRGMEDIVVEDHVPIQLPSGEAGTEE